MKRTGTNQIYWPKDANGWVSATWALAHEKHERYLKEAEVARLLGVRSWHVTLVASLRWIADGLESHQPVAQPNPHRTE